MIATPDAARKPVLTIPKIRTDQRRCLDRGPRYLCSRAAGHTGRHLFAWTHLDGRVRGVWGCHGYLKPGHYCAECGAYRGES